MRTTSSFESSRVAQRAALFLFVMAATVSVWSALAHAFKRDTLTLLTSSAEVQISIEVAETPEQQALGLMFRTSLPDTSGMLFPYPTAREITMWMKNTYIPLDMVFIRRDGIVHRIAVRTEPLSENVIGSEGAVTAVLELAGGAAERLGLKVGDRVRHPHFSLK